MKKSQEIILSDQQNLPPNRREVMKKGLGLTLGSGALGLAGLGVSTSADATMYYPTLHQTDIDKNSILYPLIGKFPNYFKRFAPVNTNRLSAFVRYRNSVYGNEIVGDVWIQVNRPYGAATFDLGKYHVNLVLDSATNLLQPDQNGIETMAVSGTTGKVHFPTEELRRRLASNDSIPFKGIIRKIYDEWKSQINTKSSISIDQMDGKGNIRTYTVSNFNEVINAVNNEAVTQRLFTFSISGASAEGVNYTRQVSVFGLSVGGFGVEDYRTFSRVTVAGSLASDLAFWGTPTELLSSPINSTIATLEGLALQFQQYRSNMATAVATTRWTAGFSTIGVAAVAFQKGVDIAADATPEQIGALTVVVMVILIAACIAVRRGDLPYALNLVNVNASAIDVMTRFMLNFPNWNIDPYSNGQQSDANGNLIPAHSPDSQNSEFVNLPYIFDRVLSYR